MRKTSLSFLYILFVLFGYGSISYAQKVVSAFDSRMIYDQPKILSKMIGIISVGDTVTVIDEKAIGGKNWTKIQNLQGNIVGWVREVKFKDDKPNSVIHDHNSSTIYELSKKPEIIKSVDPKLNKKDKIDGDVILRILIDEKGNV